MTEAILQELASPNFDAQRCSSYLALDVPNWSAAERIVAMFGDVVTGYKVGLQLFTAEGFRVVEELHKRGKRVFLDVKFHDIPNTVAGAVGAAAKLGVEMVNVHASGGRRMLERAKEAVVRESHPPLLIGVTVLTSMDAEDLQDVGVDTEVPAQVVRLAKLSAESGLDGVVASALEVQAIRDCTHGGFEIVVPGTRLPQGEMHDQSRVLTPGEAMRRGATRLVIGRAVTLQDEPLTALLAVWTNMRAGGKPVAG